MNQRPTREQVEFLRRQFRDLEQAIQPDEFSVAAPKPAKASKTKAEKEPER